MKIQKWKHVLSGHAIYIDSPNSVKASKTRTASMPLSPCSQKHLNYNFNGWQLAKMKKSIPDLSLP